MTLPKTVLGLLFHEFYAPISTIVWSVITAHNLTPEKGDNNYSSVSLLLGFSAIASGQFRRTGYC